MATREQLEADRETLRAARVSLLAGQTVREVSRDGRKLVFQTPTADGITAAIAALDADIAALDAAAGTAKPRYRGLSVDFRGW